MTSPRRSGRRPGDSGTREAILAAAKESFAASGYDATTIRGVGRTASVDPALVHHFFGTKQDLFAAAMELPVDPAQIVPALLADGVDGGVPWGGVARARRPGDRVGHRDRGATA